MGLFTTLIYQPFFNLLVGVNFLIGLVTGLPQEKVDMGIAVIVFTILFRILWLPISFASGRSAKERREISRKIAEIKKTFAKEPIRERLEIKKLMKGNRRIFIMSGINLFFQLLIMLTLYLIFTNGLSGADFHLIYSWMPAAPESFNLTFLNRFDLTRPSVTLNIINALVIFVAEGLSGWLSPFPAGRTELMALIVLPLGAFTFFAFMPAGKKLFVITTLLFSIGIMLVKLGKILYHKSRGRLSKVAYSLILDKKKEK